MSYPTQARLRELFTHDPAEGFFRRRTVLGGNPVGSIAGNLRPSGNRRINVDGSDYNSELLISIFLFGNLRLETRWSPESARWKASVLEDGRIVSLGLFETKEEGDAAAADYQTYSS